MSSDLLFSHPGSSHLSYIFAVVVLIWPKVLIHGYHLQHKPRVLGDGLWLLFCFLTPDLFVVTRMVLACQAVGSYLLMD